MSERFQLDHAALVSGHGTLSSEGLRGLPRDLLRDASKRLSAACFVFSFLWTMAILINMFWLPGRGLNEAIEERWPYPGLPISLVMLAVSIGVGAYARHKSKDPVKALSLALAYQLVMALGVAMMNFSVYKPYSEQNHLNFLAIIILIFPLIVPNTPRRTLIVSLAVATLGPLGMLYLTLRGNPAPEPEHWFLLNFITYIMAFVAVIPAKIVVGLGREVSKARELGSYRLEEMLGKGGMGEVWKAKHRMLARPAAIKLIRPDVLGNANGAAVKMTLQRFGKEAQSTAALRSPHTVELYDFGINDEGVFYYVMELLDGFDLDSLVKKFGPVDPARTVHILRQACHSLQEAHESGMVHRDIKPANIFVCRMGTDVDFVKVLDFGLVKSTGQAGAEEGLKTAQNVISGTPAYIAPEAISGEGAIDGRADLYALGCVAYWMLSGRLVFEADSPVKFLFKHANEPPVPPSRFTATRIPPDLEQLVLRMLSKDPADRPRTAAELSKELAACALDEGWSEERMQQWWRTNNPLASAESLETQVVS